MHSRRKIYVGPAAWRTLGALAYTDAPLKQVLLLNGKPVVEEVPAPCAEPGFVVVRVRFSAISSGTERSSLSAAAEPLWKKALRHPEKALKAIQMARTEGVARTIDAIQGKLAAAQTIGYSAAGVVAEVGAKVGDGVAHFRPGDRVACAGAGYANHAEIIRVPLNLVVPIPPAVDFAAASSVALGGIALQGLRRAGPTLGERFLVLGLGLLGQLTVQMLRASGCRTIGYDPQADRVRLAETLGLEAAIDACEADLPAAVVRLTGGLGVDGTIVTASTPSSDVLSSALRATRRKGRVVIVGDVGLNLVRADIYPGEKDVFISTSYGPGRYDPEYEEKGHDYPLAYVRWTENRNMEEYLRLLAAAAVRVEPLVGATVPVAEAERAYELLSASAEGGTADGKPRPLLILLSYPERAADPLSEPSPRKVVHVRGPARPVVGLIRTAIVGAGSFATSVHLPNLAKLRESFTIQTVMSRSGVNAAAAAKRFGARSSTTDLAVVLGDPEVDLVVISTRHNLHAELAARALEAGKHVFVEKPIATDRAGLDLLIDACERAQKASNGPPVLFVGFNRRFSPYLERAKKLIAGRQGPLVVHYRVNAGSLPPGHWVLGEEGGGRNIGEACHFYDVFTFLTGRRVASIDAVPTGTGAAGTSRGSENFSASISFADGSLCTLLYTASGSCALGKERMELFVDGKSLVLDDFRSLELHGFAGDAFSTRGPEKGHLEELEALARSLRTSIPEERKWPIPLEELIQSAEIAFAVEDRLQSGRRGR